MTDRWPVHTVVFDLDDTLYPERDYVFSGFNAVGAWLTGRHGKNGFAEQAKALFQQDKRKKIFDEVLLSLDLPSTPETIGELLAVYREHMPKITLYPDADETLKSFTGNFNLGLITDGYAGVQERKINALGLEGRIPQRIITDALGREFWKPSIVPFRQMMSHYPGAAPGFVYVGDNPRKDFIGARQLGWRTLRIQRSGIEHAGYVAASHEAADGEITSLAELVSLIEPAGSLS
jgi:putative hydrolase of the HAD superfamily